LSEFLIRFTCAVYNEASSAKHQLEVGAAHACFKEIRTTKQEMSPAQNDGFTAAYLLRLLRRGAGAAWNPNEVRVTVCDPTVLPDGYLGVHVFAGDRMGTALRFPTEWLFTPVAPRRMIENSVSPEQLAGVPNDFIDAFQQTVVLQLHDPDLNLDCVAQLSGVSRQSLQRQLRVRGTSFSAELAAIKKIRAADLLVTTARPITEIAQALGFVDPTSFTRAFKSWTGESPREYRKNRQ
jgi:AraC-like DNA-binding protein